MFSPSTGTITFVVEACQSGCQGFVGQGLSAGSFQQGFLNSDPWANWINQRQFYNQQLLLQQQFRDAQSVPVPPSVSSTPGLVVLDEVIQSLR